LRARHRLAVARLWYEGSSFNPVPRRLADFAGREWVKGASAASHYAGTATEMGAVVDFADAHPDWDVAFLRCTSAIPGGPVAQADLDKIIDEIVCDVVAGGDWDALYLSLHGALIGTEDLSPDLTLLRRVRTAIDPKVPLAASFDMHACLNPEVGDLVDVLTGYRSYPHVDMHETACRALTLLKRRVLGEIDSRVTLLPVPMLPPSHEMRTDAGPMAEMVDLAAKAEHRPGIHAATVFGGFAYADTPDAHATICLCHDRSVDVGSVAQTLAGEFLARHAAFLPDLPGPEQGLERARRHLAEGARWPVAVVDPADNPLSGGLGDTTGLFRALLASTCDLPTVFAFFHDPEVVDRAHAAGAGAELHVDIGGRIAPAFGAPVRFSAVVERLTDGRFRNSGPMERGVEVNLGRTAVLRRDNLRVVVSETCESANDPAWCVLHGIELADTALFCVKAKNHFRAAFGPLCGAVVTVDSPGPAPADLQSLPYRHVPAHYLTPRKEP